MADKKLIGEIKGKLNRNRNDLLTAKGARKNALNQISAPNLSDEERAKFRRLYQQYDAQIKKLEAERKNFEKELNKAEAEVPEYDKEKGAKDVKLLQEQYDLLAGSYNAIKDKTSSNALALKKQMDDLAVDFQKAYTQSVGTPVSLAAAKAKLSGVSFARQTSTGEPVTLEATKTAETTATKEAGTKTGANKKPPADNKPSIDTGKVSTTNNLSGAKKPSRFEDLIGRTEFWYNLPDYIFTANPALKDILVKAVDQDWDEAKFLAAAQQTPWWQQNSASIRTRIIDKAKYDELRGQGLDVSKTDYALDANTIKRRIKGIAQQKGANLSEEQLDSLTAQAYSGFLENDTTALNQLVAPYIGKVPAILKGATGVSSTYTGEALQNYQTLQNIARQNGFKLTDILPRVSELTAGGNLEDAVLRKLALGELDVNAIAQNARLLAAAGQPQYVRDLLNQGYDLADVYAPYRDAMSKALEISPDQIELSDPTLRMGISDKGDINLYDYQKILRNDTRWQYTKQARDEVANATRKILQDFGFMG